MVHYFDIVVETAVSPKMFCDAFISGAIALYGESYSKHNRVYEDPFLFARACALGARALTQ